MVEILLMIDLDLKLYVIFIGGDYSLLVGGNIGLYFNE